MALGSVGTNPLMSPPLPEFPNAFDAPHSPPLVDVPLCEFPKPHSSARCLLSRQTLQKRALINPAPVSKQPGEAPQGRLCLESLVGWAVGRLRKPPPPQSAVPRQRWLWVHVRYRDKTAASNSFRQRPSYFHNLLTELKRVLAEATFAVIVWNRRGIVVSLLWCIYPSAGA